MASARTDDGHRRVFELVMRYGWNAMAFQTLGEGYEYLFRGDGCVAYADTGAAWVAAGPPIAASENLSGIANAFMEAARQVGHRCCFFGSEERFVRATSDVLLALPIGEQPVWDPRDWNHTLERHAELRGQLRRARVKGVRVRPLARGQHTGSDTLGASTKAAPKTHRGDRPWRNRASTSDLTTA